jgi:D-alanyl-D-alanine carboxypeptidase
VPALALATAGCGEGDPDHEAPASASTGADGGSGGATSTSSATTGGAGGAAGTGGAPDACTVHGEAMQEALADGWADAGTPGAALAVSTPACGLWLGAVGSSTADEALRADQVMRIGSVTKTFVAAAILQLAEEGQLALDDPTSAWVEGVPDGEAITLRMLLSHRSGLFNYTEDPGFWTAALGEPEKKWTPAELVAWAVAEPPLFAPGADFSYSNTNYIVLGMVAEAASGQELGALVRERFLDPLALERTSFDGLEPVAGDLAHGYLANGDDATHYMDPSWAWAAGAIVSDVGDLVRWSAQLYGGDVLSAEMREAMVTAIGYLAPGNGYGLGAIIVEPPAAPVTAYGHGGDIPGYHTHVFYMPDQQAAFAAVTNGDDDTPNPITARVITLLAD